MYNAASSHSGFDYKPSCYFIRLSSCTVKRFQSKTMKSWPAERWEGFVSHSEAKIARVRWRRWLIPQLKWRDAVRFEYRGEKSWLKWGDSPFDLHGESLHSSRDFSPRYTTPTFITSLHSQNMHKYLARRTDLLESQNGHHNGRLLHLLTISSAQISSWTKPAQLIF